MSAIQNSTAASRAMTDAIAQRQSDRTANGAAQSRRTDRSSHIATPATTRTAAQRTQRVATPPGVDAELWQSLSADELEHFFRPQAATLLFAPGYSGRAAQAGVPRGMHLDIRA